MASVFDFGDMSDEEVSSLFSKLRTWQQKLVNQYSKSAGSETAEAMGRHAMNLSQMLKSLPSSTSNILMQEYVNIIGLHQRLDEAIQAGTMNDALTWMKTGRGGYARANVTSGLDPDNLNPLAMIYNRMNIRMAPWRARKGGPEVDQYWISRNIMNVDHLERLYNQLRSGSPINTPNLGKSTPILIFDTETGGLSETAGVRQVTAFKMEAYTDATGDVMYRDPAQVFDKHFQTARMQLGHLYDGGESARMDRALQRMGVTGPPVNAVPGAGDEFVEAMKPFLDEVINVGKAGGHIAGHNVQFDIDQVFQNLRSTAAYKENTKGFARMLDEASEYIIKEGVLLDTAELARVRLSGLGLDPALSAIGKGGEFSMANLMLQTNLAELLIGEKDVGLEGFKEMIGIGSRKFMHMAEVDTRIESYLLKYLASDKLVARELNDTAMGNLGALIKRAVVTSYAPTPISNIADISHIDPSMFRAMWTEAIDEDTGELVGDAVSLGDMEIQQLNSVFGKGNRASDYSADEVRQLLSDHTFEGHKHRFKITPLEQEIFMTRGMMRGSGKSISDKDLLFSLGQSRDFLGMNRPYEGFSNAVGTLFKRGVRPSQAEFNALRGRLADAGLPFAGLSLPERWLTTAMAQASGYNSASLGPVEANMAKYAPDLGITRFDLFKKAYISAGEAVTLPVELLQEATRRGVISTGLLGADTPEMIGMSLGRTPRGGKQVFFRMDLADQQARAMADWLEGLSVTDKVVDGKGLSDLGLGRQNLSQLVDLLRTDDITRAPVSMRDSERVVSFNIGRLSGKAGSAAYDAMVSLLGSGDELRDETLLRFRAGLMSSDAGEGVGRLGAFVLDRFMDATDATYGRGDYAEDMAQAARMDERVRGLFKHAGNVRTASVAAEGGRRAQSASNGGANVEDVFSRTGSNRAAVERGHRWAEAFRGKALPAVGAALALGTIGLMANRSRKQNKFDETFEVQEIERPANRRDYYRELGQPNMNHSSVDPLATAGLVDALHNNSINHALMGTQKYNGLFNGAI